ncbi:MAG: hypothetical protein UX85_C0002G0066 [Candidatus Beckwithbacteria bacterium GW2011_GWB1_47_15]|uniref:Glycosyltransferase RgtA/B/C/D-like domain-containing protein n=1 Tax=Candidatus Beckwithbacteria bacterium GW2011_GWB1_47_15 TaxID=1618371 RepID=A0A0G1RX64_9BACT|nr:MAG: PMT family glycosyltransferase, 4-amino-4-deoxy-L-arabinose transferase [Candidatus Beckwithbacteria bacterium GW2011_GWC1_49_16]KKU35632.1 MAG: hypothetical protein UX50_C0002G0059 [Candidatus Beckwithbacteria bacterium GW2011_GWA1_46_30]KKU61686.1 MAG: hypothetical protein UX85_C0002G0066 [Candidatus Beckwithbacteria bacterium GW2011_GWB1_47_15]KKU72189.1 MAG: hypothetical protein UX97_C0001G0059 [Candidatus Beckwithbacteria bacterium GW2011_GWA2_47_25]KKW04814.1 MAG: hypothetical pro
MEKSKIFLTGLAVFAATFAPRLYRIDNPVADWHSWRQADTAAVARNFVKGNFNLLYPQSDSLLPLNPKQLENPQRLFINEFPFYNAIVALLYRTFGINEAIARLVSVFFASLGAVFLYLFTLKLFKPKVALIAAFFYAFNPYNIYYGRVIMPDPTFVSLSIISLYFFVLWVKSNRWRDAFLTSLTLALAVLVKPYALFVALPMVYFVLAHKKAAVFKNPQAYFIAFFSLAPFVLWRYHYLAHPEANFDTNWLFNQTGIRFTGAYFRWLIFERLNRLIFATGGFVLFIVGILNSYQDRNRRLVLTWLISVVLYLVIFAMGNVTHDYYQLPLLPVGSILVALGFWFLVDQAKSWGGKVFSAAAAAALLVISFGFGWYEVRGFFNVNHWEIVAAGQAVDRLTPKDALVIAAYDADPAFLYQTNRSGWPLGVDIEDKIAAGATHYVTVNFDSVASYFEDRCQTLEKTDQYLILDLTDCTGL